MPSQGRMSMDSPPAPRSSVSVKVIGLMRKLMEDTPAVDIHACPGGTHPQSGPSSNGATSRNHGSKHTAPEVVDLTMIDSDDEVEREEGKEQDVAVKHKEGQENKEAIKDEGYQGQDEMRLSDVHDAGELMDVQAEDEWAQGSEGMDEEPCGGVERPALGSSIIEFYGDVGTSPLCIKTPSMHKALGSTLSSCGEVRVLGHTLVGPAYGLFCQLQQRHGPDLTITMDNEKYDETVIQRIIQSARRLIFPAGHEGQGIRCGGFNLPPELECKGCFTDMLISRFDHRRMLAGQRGVFATERIPKHCVLGPYRNLTLPERFFDYYMKNPPPRWKEYARGRCSHPDRVWEFLVNSYSADAYLTQVTNSRGGHRQVEEKYRLTMSAFGYGNKTALVNDHHMDPLGFSWGEDCTSYLDLPCETSQAYRAARLGKTYSKPNVDIQPIYINGFPFLFLISIREIGAREELLYDYGYEFWDCLKPLLDHLDAADKALVKKIMRRK
ncbi:unnamed protein product [Ostreobium quekettii]|uniref:SET domain-containing protein n=1 Tax=Ostreobium quekettii TaxID=121088 RepID=A0A8S1J1X6_9CHLO|nr:unnamed protein product [Ostreobium quekettii]|eukprot:evm.model.scf_599.2 EVM.evm.TU.scf_599.2   scf_599:11339-12826(-)